MKDVLEDANGRILVFPLEDEGFDRLMIKEDGKWKVAYITSEELRKNFWLIEDEERTEALFEESKLERNRALIDDFDMRVTNFVRSKRKTRQKWEIKVADNFHFPDENPYSHGLYDTEEEAIAEAKRIIDEDILPAFKNNPDISFKELWDNYITFGADPAIPGSHFSAWDYAEKRCRELCEKRKVT